MHIPFIKYKNIESIFTSHLVCLLRPHPFLPACRPSPTPTLSPRAACKAWISASAASEVRIIAWARGLGWRGNPKQSIQHMGCKLVTWSCASIEVPSGFCWDIIWRPRSKVEQDLRVWSRSDMMGLNQNLDQNTFNQQVVIWFSTHVELMNPSQFKSTSSRIKVYFLSAYVGNLEPKSTRSISAMLRPA